MPPSLLNDRYSDSRKLSLKLCKPLQKEDYVVQPIEAASPPKWHLAHTTWFFETFILKKNVPSYIEFNPKYSYLFNSYYVGIGERAARPDRGFMTRPTVEEVFEYRNYVDAAMADFLKQEPDDNIKFIIETGINHEQQHQELLLYDIKCILGSNPLYPEYLPINNQPAPPTHMDRMLSFEEGIYEIGYDNDQFHFDNEKPFHKVYLQPFKMMNRLVTNEEYAAFIEDGGYQDFRLWFMEAFEWVEKNDIIAPLYWHKIDGIWHRYALRGGLKPIDPKAPVTHISMYEADAFAKWSGKRLPTEFEWEVAAGIYGDISMGNYSNSEFYEPQPAHEKNNQFFGDTWEWTGSAYLPYPGYKAAEGAIGEYNGKFMINQMVLRGGSCASPANHLRKTYRNFFHPSLRWMFSGLRLAESA